MTLDDLMYLELILFITLNLIRSLVNLVLMYRIEKFKIPSLRPQYTLHGSLGSFQEWSEFYKKMGKSTLKLWWTGDQYKFEKRIANVLSVLFLTSIIVLILTFVIGYKI